MNDLQDERALCSQDQDCPCGRGGFVAGKAAVNTGLNPGRLPLAVRLQLLLRAVRGAWRIFPYFR